MTDGHLPCRSFFFVDKECVLWYNKSNGNPTNYLGHTLAWEKGRQLKSFDGNTYRYNNDGIRIEKVENCKTHKYILDGTNILKEIVEDTCCNCTGYTNEYLYDLDGTVCGLKYNELPMLNNYIRKQFKV